MTSERLQREETEEFLQGEEGTDKHSRWLLPPVHPPPSLLIHSEPVAASVPSPSHLKGGSSFDEGPEGGGVLEPSRLNLWTKGY